MRFFSHGAFGDADQFPRPDPPEQPEIPPWFQPRSDELPLPLAVGRILATAPAVVLSLRRIDVNSNGCAFKIQVDARRDAAIDDDRWDEIVEGLHLHRRRRDRNTGLRLGVTLADGVTATAGADDHRFPDGLDGDARIGPVLSLHGSGGHGTEDSYSMAYRAWLWPLPPAGPLVLHYQWRQLGIDEGASEFDATLILAAATDVQQLWG